MKKKTNLECGFLFLYDWMPALELLPAKEVKALLLALIARQRENKPLPAFRNPLTDSFARMIEPVICRRLEGAVWAKKGLEEQGSPKGSHGRVPHPQREDETSKDEMISEESRKETPSTEGAALMEGALRALSEQEKAQLLSEGLPADYIAERTPRALAFAEKSRRSATVLLREWWQRDKKPTVPCPAASEGSFDADEFWQAAVNRA